MALKPCQECGREISDRAKSCPQCGFRVARTWKIPIFAFWAAPVCALGAAVWWVLGTGAGWWLPAEGVPFLNHNADRAARYACAWNVRVMMSDPESVDFSEWTDASISKPSANSEIYEVNLTLRGRNAFNAPRTGKMFCLLDRDGGRWKILDVREIR